MRIINLAGTAEKSCVCGDWLRHWENISRRPAPRYCAVEDCLNTDLVGAHVKVASGDGTTYICPLCKKHNQSSGTLLIPDNFPLVLANKARTCEKPRQP